MSTQPFKPIPPSEEIGYTHLTPNSKNINPIQLQISGLNTWFIYSFEIVIFKIKNNSFVIFMYLIKHNIWKLTLRNYYQSYDIIYNGLKN